MLRACGVALAVNLLAMLAIALVCAGLAYALAVATSVRAERILMAGFDGYPAGDARNAETATVLDSYRAHVQTDRLISVTPTRHRLPAASIYSPGL